MASAVALNPLDTSPHTNFPNCDMQRFKADLAFKFGNDQ